MLELRFLRDGSRLLSASSDGTVRLWYLAAGVELARFEGHSRPVNAIEVSADESAVLTGSDDDTVKIWPLTVPPGGLEAVACAWLQDYDLTELSVLHDITLDEPICTDTVETP